MTCSLKIEAATTPANDGPDLIGRARSGDCEAFDALCREHGSRLLGQAIVLCRNRNAAEDLVQETLIEAWRSLSHYNGQCRLFTWLCSILIHRHRNSLRKKWPLPFSFFFRSDHDDIQSSLAETPDPAPGPDLRTEQAERAAWMLRALERLPTKQREVVYLRFYADDSLEGIAAALGCSIGTVKSRLSHGLERLRQIKSFTPGNAP